METIGKFFRKTLDKFFDKIDNRFKNIIVQDPHQRNKCCEVIAILASTLMALIFGFTGLLFGEGLVGILIGFYKRKLSKLLMVDNVHRFYL